MPTVLPARSGTVAAYQQLSWLNTVRVIILLAQVRWLNRRLEAARRRVDRYGLEVAGPDLVLTATRWLAVHETIGDLLGCPEPPHVAQVRATLQMPASQRMH